MAVEFDVTEMDRDLIRQIVDRAKGYYEKQGVPFDRQGVEMDITAVHRNGCPLDLRAFLEADSFDFTHDLAGINRCLDRTTGQLMRGFLPRHARAQRYAQVEKMIVEAFEEARSLALREIPEGSVHVVRLPIDLTGYTIEASCEKKTWQITYRVLDQAGRDFYDAPVIREMRMRPMQLMGDLINTLAGEGEIGEHVVQYGHLHTEPKMRESEIVDLITRVFALAKRRAMARGVGVPVRVAIGETQFCLEAEKMLPETKTNKKYRIKYQALDFHARPVFRRPIIVETHIKPLITMSDLISIVAGQGSVSANVLAYADRPLPGPVHKAEERKAKA